MHDYVIGINRLGRGDGSTTIGANMHIFRPWWITRAWRAAKAAGDKQQADKSEQLLRRIAAKEVVICALLSEPGTDILHPLVEATKAEGGWLLNGRKIFGTMSPAAQILDIACRFRTPQGDFRRAMTMVPSDSSGVEIKNNWDALGMRGSGSHDVVFKDCFIPDGEIIDTGPWGDWSVRAAAANAVLTLGLVGAFLGIAEAARDLIIEMVKSRRKGVTGRTLAERYSIQHVIAEIEIDLTACRAMIERTAAMQDTFFHTHPGGSEPLDQLHDLMKDFQCTKWFVNRKAIEIVDRALTVSGGAGYLSKSPLSRLYRDVRAGPFMQPLSPNEAFEYIGKVTLGLEPRLDA